MPPTCKKGIKNLLINQCLQAISWTKVGTRQGFTRMHQAQLWELLQHRKSDSKVTTSIKARRFCCRQRTLCCRFRCPAEQGRGGAAAAGPAPVPSWLTEPHTQPPAPAEQLCSQQTPAKPCCSRWHHTTTSSVGKVL